jgi:hypothetical protein
MGELLSCPFCRELYSEEEGPKCPECDLPLVRLRDLPLSLDGQAELLETLGSIDPPEDQQLPTWYLGRGKGAAPLLGAVGLALFFQPWVSLTRPDPITLSGHDLATTNAPWLWGGAVGFFLLIPLVLSRRTVRQLLGIRVIASFFPLLTLGEATLLLANPPEGHRYFGSGLSYEWGLYASALVAILCIAVSARLGGSLKDMRDLPVKVPGSGPSAADSLH